MKLFLELFGIETTVTVEIPKTVEIHMDGGDTEAKELEGHEIESRTEIAPEEPFSEDSVVPVAKKIKGFVPNGEKEDKNA